MSAAAALSIGSAVACVEKGREGSRARERRARARGRNDARAHTAACKTRARTKKRGCAAQTATA